MTDFNIGGGKNVAWHRKGFNDAEHGRQPNPPEDPKQRAAYMMGYRGFKKRQDAIKREAETDRL